jgi:hypothetical protein
MWGIMSNRTDLPVMCAAYGYTPQHTAVLLTSVLTCGKIMNPRESVKWEIRKADHYFPKRCRLR